MLRGILGKKLGMTQVYDKSGAVVPVTVIEAGPCYITGLFESTKKAQIAFGTTSKKQTKSIEGHLKKAGIDKNLKHFCEFKADTLEGLAMGQEIKADIFKEGEIIAVTGTSIGKGFAGTVKRHHFSRGPMTHGSKSHRIPGSIGAGTTPGRVYKGKKLAGRMGGVQVTVKNLVVVGVDVEKNTVLLRGAVPGVKGTLLMLRKGKKSWSA